VKPDLELLLELRAELGTAIVVGPTPEGLRRVVPIRGGAFEGPRLRGEVLAGGADWQYVRNDDVTVVEAQYLLRTHDEVLLQVHNRGLRHGPAEVLRRLSAGDPVDPSEYYFRAAPSFSAPAGPYEWLNRSLFVCSGARRALSVELRFYRVT
jgi:Protein of unknown function (DUF3237)